MVRQGLRSVVMRKYNHQANHGTAPDDKENLQENLIASKDVFPSEEAFQHEVEQMNETCEQVKQHLVDTNRVVKKRTSGITVKVYSEN